MSDGGTPETSALRESVTRFTKSEITQHLAQWEDDLELPRELHQKAADAGLLGVGFSEDVGREGCSLVDSSVVSEAIMEVGGPNVAGITISARRDGEDFIVNRAKTFITTAVRTGGEGADGIRDVELAKNTAVEA